MAIYIASIRLHDLNGVIYVCRVGHNIVVIVTFYNIAHKHLNFITSVEYSILCSLLVLVLLLFLAKTDIVII